MGCSAGGHRVPGLSLETHCRAGLGLHRLFSSPCGKSRRPRRLGTRRSWSGDHLLRGFLLWGGGDSLPALPPPFPRSRAGRGSHLRGGRRGGRRLRSPGAAGGCGGDRRPRERSARSRWPASWFLQPGGSAGGAIALETSTLPACGHFRILYAGVISCFLPSFHLFFRGFACGESRDASTESFSVGFCVLWFGLVFSVSQAPFGSWLWNSLSWISPPRGGLRTTVRAADLCRACGASSSLASRLYYFSVGLQENPFLPSGFAKRETSLRGR